MSKREAFFDAACKENVGGFLRFVQLHKVSSDPFDVEEVVQELPWDQRAALWGRLATLLQHVLLELPPEQWGSVPKKDRMESGEEAKDPKHVMSVVEGVTLVVTLSVNVLQDGDTYSTLLDCADRLHDVLASMPVSEAPLQLCIQKLCEAWWKKGLQEKEKFGRTAFLVSLQKSFILKKPGSEIQRLWVLHDVLLGLDFTSEDNKHIINLLLQCFLCTSYIRNDDGKRFLVFLFSWHINFIWMIHGTIKNQLEFLSKTLVNHIAEIYFRAWKKASGDFQEKIESICIQNLMEHAILLHRASAAHAKVRQIVSYFHKRKGCNQVDKMLYILYKPILWRALSAPNFEVRANATFLFTEAFAVHDPGEGSDSINQTIQKQLDTLMVLLDDPHPLVRSTATLGVCKILAGCWELLPATVITDFLKKLVIELAADTSSPDVRCAVFKCLAIVLDNPLSHPLLEKLLPALKYSLHDNSERVRIAFLDLLIKVKAVRAAKFWDVCNMDHLLARLAVDSKPVSKRIVNLLFKSFFPVNEAEVEWCNRCITLIQMNRKAARKFYQLAYIYTAPTNIVKLMLTIRRVLNSCVQSSADMTDMDESNKENSRTILSGKDMGIVASLLEVVVILWKTIDKALEHNKEAKEYATAKFCNVMSKYFNTFQDEQCTAPLTFLASLMPPATVPTFSYGVLSRLRRIGPGAVQRQYSQLIDCLCGWGQAGDILQLITDWLSEALPKKSVKASASRKVQIQETVAAKPDLALDYLEYLFSCTTTRISILSLNQGLLKQLHKVLGTWRLVLYTHLTSGTDPSNPSAEVALKAFTLHCRLSAHLQHSSSEGRDYLLSLECVVTWVAERVLPFLVTPSQGDGAESKEPLALARQIVESFLTVCRDILLVGLVDEELKGQMLHLCSLILLSEKGYLCIPLLLPIVKEVAESFVPKETQEEQQNKNPIILSMVTSTFQKLVELLAHYLRKKPEEGQQLCQSTMPSLSDFLQVVQTWEGISSKPLNEVFSTLLAGIIVENQYRIQKISHPDEVTILQSVEDMPPLSSMLLSVVLKLPPVTRTFLTEIRSSLDSENIDSLMGLAAVLNILNVISHTRQVKAALKDTAISVQRQLQKLAVTAEDSGDIQRVIYESAVKTLNGILNL
ncbi:condensin-2 complex subunit G2 [Lampris incognitus]|uniref:condensin-2 complex subunit G2 n=1 Tax=Lampris incognitus TaxID=2546036 RepID=UPI0024B5BAE4|nr:condensin-2 complex subunit G2 [Lampris incognitus]